MFHNLSECDAHLIIKELGRKFNNDDIGVIAANKEKYISFNVKVKLRFIDSCRFMTSSLDKLASNLCGTSGIQCDKCKGNIELINISGGYIASFGCERYKTKKTKDLDREVLKNNSNQTSGFWRCDEKFRLMSRKGVYPYEYMDGWEKFDKTSLPPKVAFYSRLSTKSISVRDYEHAQQVWNTMEKKTLGCYHDT